MDELLIIFVKFLVASALLYLLFLGLFKGKAAHKSQRLFLLLLPVTSLFFALFSLEIIPINKIAPVIETISQNEIYNIIELENFDEQKVIFPQTETVAAQTITLKGILLVVWAIVALIILCHYLLGAYKISKIARHSSRKEKDGIAIYQSFLIPTPFSFFRQIFINDIVSEQKYEFILKHEMAHISSKHYLDKLVMELYIIVGWFNPILWLINREIGAVHEFEADSIVLNDNCDRKLYKRFLFEEVDYTTPQVANGFNNSLIKQRFIQMASHNIVKNSKLRNLLTIPLVALIFSICSLTYVRGSESRSNQIETSSIHIEIPHIVVQKDDIVVTGIPTVKKDEASTDSTPEIDPKDIKKVTVSKQDSTIIKKNRDTIIQPIRAKKQAEVKEGERLRDQAKFDFYTLKREQMMVVDKSKAPSDVVTIYRYNTHTEVDYVSRISWNWQWVNFSSNLFLVDKESGDRYRVHSIKNDVPLDRNLVYKNMGGKYCILTLIFPPLDKSIKKVDFIEGKTSGVLIPENNAGPFRFYNVKIERRNIRPYSNIEDREAKTFTLDDDFKLPN